MNFEEISVVIQGKVKTYTNECIASYRKHMPGCEIVLSCWEADETDDMDYDVLVKSKDPGGQLQNKSSGVLLNINRQIVSTNKGLSVASRKYVLKTRTDLQIKSNEFLKEFGKYNLYSGEYKYFSERVLILNYYTSNPRIIQTPFHYSDWIAFGVKEDVIMYYNIPLVKEDEIRWFDEREKKTKLFENYRCRYLAEQYFAKNMIESKNELYFENYYQDTKNNILVTELVLVNNFVVIDYKDNFNFRKYNPNRYGDCVNIYSSADWKILYNLYCAQKNNRITWFLYISKSCLRKIVFNIMTEISVFLGRTHLKEKLRTMIDKRRCYETKVEREENI